MRTRGGHAVSLYVQSSNDAEFQQQTDLPLVFSRVVVRDIARSYSAFSRLGFHCGGFHSDAIHNDVVRSYKLKVIAFPLPAHPSSKGSSL